MLLLTTMEGPLGNLQSNLANTRASAVCLVKLKTEFELEFMQAMYAPGMFDKRATSHAK